MGDRANVVLKASENAADLVLYTHWGGYRVEQTLADGMRAAQAGGRLQGDASYGFRSIVQVFFEAIGPATDLGGGIAVGEPWEPHVVVFDYDAQTVTFDPACNEYGPEDGTVTESVENFLLRFPAKVEEPA